MPRSDKTLVFHAVGMSVCDDVGMRTGWHRTKEHMKEFCPELTDISISSKSIALHLAKKLGKALLGPL